ncbi:MAG TPA: DUF6364 family protein [Mucilaginibacter sp.]|nr:DUF6364 family protein [Mucilaginibacter sp.]
MAKLTLSIAPDKIEIAKRYASRHRTSISRLFSDFISEVAKKEEAAENDPFLEKLKKMDVSEEVKALSGILKGKVPDDINLWDAKYEYLREKHGL